MVESSSSSTSVSKLYASKQAIWRVLGLIAVLIVIVAYNGNSTVKVDENDCYSEFKHGQWVSHRWYPFRCIINRYPTKSSLLGCIHKPNARKNIAFIGDVNLAKYYRALVSQFTSDGDYSLPPDLESNPTVSFVKNDLNADFMYIPLLTSHFINRFKFQDQEQAPHIVVASFGNFNGNPTRRTCFSFADRLIKHQMDFIEKLQEEEQITPIIIMMFQEMETVNNKNCLHIIKRSYDEKVHSTQLLRDSLIVLDLNKNNPLQGLEVIVHFMCNSPMESTCCMSNDQDQHSSMTLPLLLLSLALYLGLSLVKATGTLLPLEPYMEAAKIDVNRVYVVINLVGFCVISALCMYCTERVHVFHHASPWRSPLLMGLLTVAVVCLGFIKTTKLNQLNVFMCKDQVSEFRGWTVLLILGLEYSNIAESNIGFWIWQLLMCCYCFSCAYSQFLWYHSNSDYSLLRLIKVVVRQNFFMVVTFLTLYSPVSVYTIPIVNTIVSVIVYVVMSLPPRLMPTSPDSKNGPSKQLLTKVILSGILIIALTLVELYIFKPSSFLFYASNPKVYFTTIYSTRMMAVLGMLMGYYSLLTNINCCQSILTTRINAAIVLIGFSVYIVFVLTAKGTNSYVIGHMFVVNLPIISYCILRNWNDLLKSAYSFVFKYIGFISIEFYILSRHTLLSHNGHGLLYLFPGYFAINMLCTLFITVLLSVAVSEFAALFDSEVMNSKPIKKSNVEDIPELPVDQVAA